MTVDPADEAILNAATRGTRVRRRRRSRRHKWWRRGPRRVRHWINRHKALSVLLGLMILLLILLLLFLWILNRKLDDVPRFPIDYGDVRPEAGVGTTILIAGVDDGKGTRLRESVKAETWPQGVFRSDALMLVHVSEDWSRAQVVSIPRDSYVDVHVPRRAADGKVTWDVNKRKINAALSLGGVDGMARTVEQFTDTRIDHVALTDFDGFAGITEILGGVLVHIPEESVRDPRLRAVGLNPGWQLLEGEPAIWYVRQRYGLPRGDFDRVQRQQNVIRQIVHKASSWTVLANPLKVVDLVDEVGAYLAVDDSLTNGRIRELALALRNLRADDIDFATIPHQGSATIDGASVVKVVPRSVRALFDAIEKDEFTEYAEKNDEVERLPGATQVR